MQYAIKKNLRNLLATLTITAISAIVSLVILEIFLRIFHPLPLSPLEMHVFRLKSSEYYQKDAELRWRPRKSIYGRHDKAGSFSTTFRTNSEGFRDKEYELEKPKEICRIIAIGDSFTWGYGVNDHEIYTERLEEMLPKTEVINLGVTAYSLQQEILYFKREGLKYAPDIVILGFCLNDIYQPHHGDLEKRATIVTPINRQIVLPVQSITSKSRVINFKQYLYRKSTLFRFVMERINSNKALVKTLVSLGIKGSLKGFEALDINLMPALRDYPESLEKSWKETRLELLQLKQLTTDLGIRLIIVVIPSVQTIQHKSFEHAIVYSIFDQEDFDLDKPYRLLGNFAEKQSIEFVNPVNLFQKRTHEGSSLYLKRDMHFNAVGHDLLAQAIAEHILN